MFLGHVATKEYYIRDSLTVIHLFVVYIFDATNNSFWILENTLCLKLKLTNIMRCSTLKEWRQNLAFEIRKLCTLLNSPLDEGWLVRVMFRQPYSWEWGQGPIAQEDGWALGPVLTVVEEGQSVEPWTVQSQPVAITSALSRNPPSCNQA